MLTNDINGLELVPQIILNYNNLEAIFFQEKK